MCQREYRRELKQVQLSTIWTIPDQMWQKIHPLLPPQKKEPGTPGRPLVPFRKVINGILFVLRTGANGKHCPAATAPVRLPTAASDSGCAPESSTPS